MKKQLGPLVLIALVVAVISTGVFYFLVSGRVEGKAQASAAKKVVVAARAIPAGSKLEVGDLKAIDWTDGEPPAETYRDAGQVSGKVTTTAVDAGEPVVAAKIASPGGGGGAGVPSGMRAISVQVGDSSGIVAILKPGFRVDVQAVLVREQTEMDVRTVAEDLEVLRVTPPAETGSKNSNPVVTLLVTPAEANALALADTGTRVRVTLRNPLDHDKSALPAQSLHSVMTGVEPWKARAAAAAPAATT